MAILKLEWWGVLDWRWKSKIPLVFSCIIITKKFGVCWSRYICDQITRNMDLSKRGVHVGLVDYTQAEGAAREVKNNRGEEEDYGRYQNFLSMVLSRSMTQAAHWETGRKGERCLLADNLCTNIR